MKRSDLNLGTEYAVRFRYPAHGPVCPPVEVRKKVEFLDLRDGGTCVVAERVVGYDLPPGRASRKVITRTVLHEVRIADVLATWEDWQTGEKVKSGGGLVLAPPKPEPFELEAVA